MSSGRAGPSLGGTPLSADATPMRYPLNGQVSRQASLHFPHSPFKCIPSYYCSADVCLTMSGFNDFPHHLACRNCGSDSSIDALDGRFAYAEHQATQAAHLLWTRAGATRTCQIGLDVGCNYRGECPTDQCIRTTHERFAIYKCDKRSASRFQ